MDISVDELLSMVDNEKRLRPIFMSNERARSIPLLPQMPDFSSQDSIEDLSAQAAAISVDYSLIGDHRAIAVVINDDKMAPIISKGDVAIIQLRSTYYDGDYVIVSQQGQPPFVARYFKDRSNNVALAFGVSDRPLCYSSEQSSCYTIEGRIIEIRRNLSPTECDIVFSDISSNALDDMFNN